MASEPFDHTSDYDPDIPDEPPFDENHHRYHTPAGPNPECANCRYINFWQPLNMPKLDALVQEEPFWQDEPIGGTFVVRWTDDTFSVKDEKWVSETSDMADYGYGDEVKEILAANEHGTLGPIRIGEQERVSSDEEYPLYFAHSAIHAGNKRVGTVSYTDH